MKIYQNRDQKNQIQCGYCGRIGHNKRHCDALKTHYNALKDLVKSHLSESIGDAHPSGKKLTQVIRQSNLLDLSLFASHWSSYPQFVNNQFARHFDYAERLYNSPTKAKPNAKRSPVSCGFCGSSEHTRRNCSAMTDFIYVLNETNKGYRQRFYDRFIEGYGFGGGCLVETVQKDWRTGEETPQVGFVTSFDPNQVQFTNLAYRWGDYHTQMSLKVMFDGQVIDCGKDPFSAKFRDNGQRVDPFCGLFSQWGKLTRVVSPAPQRVDKEWFLSSSPSYDWVVKKRSQSDLMSSFYALIKEFYPHDDLKARLGSEYERYYTD